MDRGQLGVLVLVGAGYAVYRTLKAAKPAMGPPPHPPGIGVNRVEKWWEATADERHPNNIWHVEERENPATGGLETVVTTKSGMQYLVESSLGLAAFTNQLAAGEPTAGGFGTADVPVKADYLPF